MNINALPIAMPKIAFQANIENKKSLLNQPIKDNLTISRKKPDEVAKYVSEMKTEDGKSRFSEKEVKEFKQLYKKGQIDYNTVESYADWTKFNMESMKNVYDASVDIPNLNKAIIEASNKLGEDKVITKFEQSEFLPKDEFYLYSEPKAKDLADKFSSLSQAIVNLRLGTHVGSTKTSFDEFGNIIAKSEQQVRRGQNKESVILTKTIDYKNNIRSERKEVVGEDGIAYTKATKIIRTDKDKNLIRKEEMTESEIKGVYNIKYTYPDGHVEDVVKASIDPKTGIKTIKKDMKSADSTRTEFLYEDDPQGNRLVDYKITDKNGKVLMKNSQTFEVISDNKFISSKNHRKYEITTDDKRMKIKDLSHERETSIEFKNKFKGNKKELTNLFKKIPGEELYEIVDAIKKIKGNNIDKILESYYNPLTKKINTSNDLFSFLHELGHAKDNEYKKFKDILSDNKNAVYQDNPQIQKTYLKERKNFNNTNSDNERIMVNYFIQAKGHYGGKWGGLSEVIAETNALTNTYTDENVRCLGDRAQLLQQHFPKTIAAIKDAMEYKNDLLALEYYGT